MPSWGWGNSVGEMPTDCHPRYAPRPNDKRAKEDREKEGGGGIPLIQC